MAGDGAVEHAGPGSPRMEALTIAMRDGLRGAPARHASKPRLSPVQTYGVVSRAKGHVMVNMGGGIGGSSLYSHAPAAHSTGTHLSVTQSRGRRYPSPRAYAGPTWSKVG